MNLQIVKTSGQSLAKIISFRDINSEKVMKDCLRQSPIVWESRIDGEGACIWGMIPPSLMSDRAYIWLYTTEIADQHTFVLVRHSKLMLENMLKEYDHLYGYCRKEDVRAIRWLKWLGAKFGEPDKVKIPFEIRKE